MKMLIVITINDHYQGSRWASRMLHLAIFVSIWLQKTVAGDISGANILIFFNYIYL
jgi:hypothetical protein